MHRRQTRINPTRARCHHFGPWPVRSPEASVPQQWILHRRSAFTTTAPVPAKHPLRTSSSTMNDFASRPQTLRRNLFHSVQVSADSTAGKPMSIFVSHIRRRIMERIRGPSIRGPNLIPRKIDDRIPQVPGNLFCSAQPARLPPPTPNLYPVSGQAQHANFASHATSKKSDLTPSITYS